MARTLRWGLALALLTGGLAAFPSVARAQVCWFTTGPTVVAFGTYDPLGPTPDDSTGTFRFDCNRANVRATVTLSPGLGTFALRQMGLGTERLSYNLYRDAACSQVWGDGSPGTFVLTNARRRTTYTIYGRVPIAQFPEAGNYTDTITMTVNY